MSAINQVKTADRPITLFAQRLRARRHELRLNQTELADKLDVQTQTVSQWERALKVPQPRFHDRLCDLLELDDKAELRELFELPGTNRGIGQRSAARIRGDRLKLVPTEDEGDDLHPLGARTAESDRLIRAAIKIIDARRGRLSDVEAQIVQALLNRAGLAAGEADRDL